jgi:hypothetical protein
MTYPDQTPLLQFILALKECLAAAVILAFLTLLFPRLLQNNFRFMERTFSRFAPHQALAVCSVFFSVLLIRVGLLPLLRVPVPGIHDEYSYLLMADTFAHGRLANPPHPMWMSFETFHVNWFPTYSSMYPPAQGLVLALGQVLGHPWIGVLLSVAAMCAAILWMLQAWMPARWAFLGGVLVALKFGIASYWMNSYWGGAVAATGGALVLGALARVVRRAYVRDSLLLGLGIALLANSRPYEGLLFCIPAAVYFLWWLLGKTGTRLTRTTRVVKALLPVSALLVLTAAFMGYYNWRVTRNVLLLPHVLNTRTYHTAPLFLWEHAKPALHYHNQQFEDFYNDWERESYQTTLHDAWAVSLQKMTRFSFGFLWAGVLLMLPGLLFVLRDTRMRFLWITFGLGLMGFLAVIWSNAHYAAPLTCVIYALIVQGLRHLRTFQVRGRRAGVLLSRAAVLLLVAGTCSLAAHRVCDPLHWPCEGDRDRAALAEQLQLTPGKHLVVVRYEPGHNIHDEWVFNGAEMDGAKVLWARELDPRQNATLFAYFNDRHIWLAEPDEDPTQLVPYTPPEP